MQFEKAKLSYSFEKLSTLVHDALFILNNERRKKLLIKYLIYCRAYYIFFDLHDMIHIGASQEDLSFSAEILHNNSSEAHMAGNSTSEVPVESESIFCCWTVSGMMVEFELRLGLHRIEF